MVTVGLIVGIILGVTFEAMNNSKTKTTYSNTLTTSTPNAPSPSATPDNASVISTPYVDVEYNTVGWFYGSNEAPDYSYNYTYLVLNVTITNHGYSQINVIGSDGFSVVVNDNTCQASYLSPSYYLTNASTIDKVYDVWKADNYGDYNFYPPPPLSDPSLPSQATLLDMGSVNGLIFFQFGNPNVYPQQPQVLNEPFVLQYSVTYGNEAGLNEPNANVVIT